MDAVSWEKVLLAFAAALALGVSAIATAWVQSRIGAAGAGALAEKPELTATVIILLAIPETIVILGFVIAAMILLGI
jgi:V/A-type H+-transporting ATPase subunit K